MWVWGQEKGGCGGGGEGVLEVGGVRMTRDTYQWRVP